MSSAEDPSPKAGRGPIIIILAVLGAVATLVVGGASVASLVSASGQDCLAQGHPRVVCSAGVIGLVDLAALAEKDRALSAATDEIASRTAAQADLERRVAESEGRAKELDAALAGAKAASAEVERLKGEIARRDARIAELGEKLATAARKPEVPPLPTARPAAPPAPAPKPKP